MKNLIKTKVAKMQRADVNLSVAETFAAGVVMPVAQASQRDESKSQKLAEISFHDE